ncbi:MAG: signal peptide peptidase SppA [Candidatus Babeliaceae bacterium]|jgi:protease-4
MAKIADYLKNIFYLLIIVQLVPLLFMVIKKQYNNVMNPKTKVAVITIKGTVDNASQYTKHLQKYFKDKEIKALLLKIDSPGGTAGTAQTIFNEIKELKKEFPKPIVSLVENSCASGAYYIACATDTIIAPASSFIGSIGVYITQPNFKEFIEQFKIHYSVTQSGMYKTVGDPLLAPTTEGQALLQELTHDTYQQFISDVAECRHIPLQSNKEWADGKIFTGRQALGLKLIDKLGCFSTTEKIIKEKACITTEIEWIKPSKPSPLTTLFGGDDQDGQSYLETTLNTVYSWVTSKLDIAIV